MTWVKIKEYPTFYVNEKGQLRNEKGNILSTTVINGRITSTISYKGKNRYLNISKLVYEYFGIGKEWKKKVRKDKNKIRLDYYHKTQNENKKKIVDRYKSVYPKLSYDNKRLLRTKFEKECKQIGMRYDIISDLWFEVTTGG